MVTTSYKYFAPVMALAGTACSLFVAVRWTIAGYGAADQALGWTTAALFIVNAAIIWRNAYAR